MLSLSLFEVEFDRLEESKGCRKRALSSQMNRGVRRSLVYLAPARMACFNLRITAMGTWFAEAQTTMSEAAQRWMLIIGMTRCRQE